MMKARCPICESWMRGPAPTEWPDWPFCSRRCKTIDLGRWLGESYRIASPRLGMTMPEASDPDGFDSEGLDDSAQPAVPSADPDKEAL
jgi:endogenous inhibitor of DNA gyrase (YacG/DUF329 family)